MKTHSIRIQSQLIKMILAACGVVLLLTSAAFFAYQILTFRQASAQRLNTLGEVIATNSTAALAFENQDDAAAVLAACKADPHIVSAALYDKRGNLFATYRRVAAPSQRTSAATSHTAAEDALTAVPRSLEPAQSPRYFFDNGYLIGEQPVIEDQRRVGTLLVKSDLRAINEQLRAFALLDGLVIAVSVVLAYLLSRRLQRQISRPILALAETARAVSDRHDYSVRAPASNAYELILLTDAFNHMLIETQRSESKMRAQLGHLGLLQNITRAIGDRHDVQKIFQRVLLSLEQDLPIDFGCVCLYNDAGKSLVIQTVGIASRNYLADLAFAEGIELACNTNGLARCISGQLIYEPDTQSVSSAFAEKLAGAGLRSVVFAPMMIEARVSGVVIAGRREPRAFSSPDCEFLRQLSEHVALATHQTQLNAALQGAYEDLRQTQATVMQQERLRALGQMASGIAHDINNAISPVALYTQSLLEREPNLSERTRSYLTTIQRAIEDVAGTVARMREFYRQREPELLQARIDLNGTIKQVVDLTRARWSDQSLQRGIVIDLRTQLSEITPEIMAAEGEIRDALTNLIFNAVDAMPEGGTLSLRTISTVADSTGLRRIHLEVSDTGIGMDEATRRRCLEPFFTTKGERGTGLGLAMVYGMIQRHSAELEVESTPGKGTTVRLIFPAYAEAFTSTARVPVVAMPAQPLRILLVDDDPLLLKSLQDILEADGHAVTATPGGQAGIGAFEAMQRSGDTFSIVITDLGMPYVDGRAVAAAIKAASSATPVIMLTGWGQRLLAENDIPPCVDRVLNKPPRLHDLRAALAELTNKRKT